MLSLANCLRAKNLVSVRRRDVDDNGIQGFLVGVSESLLALEYVYDFKTDGLMILRRSDITEVRRTATDDFHERLLKRVGIRAGRQGPAALELGSWQTIIQQLSLSCPLMILERELGPSPEFVIGRPQRVTAAQVEFHSFSGTGKWSDKTVRLKYTQITCLQTNTRYLDFYQRYFERTPSRSKND